jgi:glycosyltransferase involved in cell wall biosynthesis
VDALIAGSQHRYTLATLPARKWKWRMRGAAMWLALDNRGWMEPGEKGPVDLIFCNDMLDVGALRALMPASMRNIPIVCYFHENQLTYPIPADEERDFQYGMTNILSCLAADAVLFNSRFHLEDFLAASTDLLAKMPDHVPVGVIEEIRQRAAVAHPPVCLSPVTRAPKSASQALTILWCHRWEFDKNPEPFFDALVRLDEAGYAFDLVMLGERFRIAPPVFEAAWSRLQRHILHSGYLPDRREYLAQLGRCDVVVSTAIQENFGIAVLEAVVAGCQPLLPHRLAYPELIPPDLHERCLYPSEEHLHERLGLILAGPGRWSREELRRLQMYIAARYGPEPTVSTLDDLLERAAVGSGDQPLAT